MFPLSLRYLLLFWHNWHNSDFVKPVHHQNCNSWFVYYLHQWNIARNLLGPWKSSNVYLLVSHAYVPAARARFLLSGNKMMKTSTPCTKLKARNTFVQRRACLHHFVPCSKNRAQAGTYKWLKKPIYFSGCTRFVLTCLGLIYLYLMCFYLFIVVERL